MINKKWCALLCCCMIFATGCTNKDEVSYEKPTPTITNEEASHLLEEEVNNNQPSVSTISEEEQQAIFGDTSVLEGDYAFWPSKKVGDVPEFNGGVITSTLSKADEIVIITFEKCNVEYVKNYLVSLENAGYVKEKLTETEHDLLGTYKKGVRELQFSYSSQIGDGSVTILIRNKEIVNASN